MKRIVVISCLLMLAGFAARSQDLSKFNLYKPSENAEAALAAAVKKAKKDNKQVLVQIGGNWCIWCARFNDFTANDATIDSLIKAEYIVYHLNYSKENKNEKMLARYSYPQRFGFPVFLVLNKEGRLIHTQNSEYLEEGKGYSKEKVLGFLRDWSVKAFDPAKYKE